MSIISVVYGVWPALAHVVTRIVTREGWDNLYLRPRLRSSWPFWTIAWFVTPLLVAAGAAISSGLFSGRFHMFHGGNTRFGVPGGWVWAFLALIAPGLGGLIAFGEEFGWRAYLQAKLLRFGKRKALVLTGIVHGAWHWPMVAVSLSVYADVPFCIRMVVMIGIGIFMATYLGWLTIKANSIWPAAIAHGAWDLAIAVERQMLTGPTLGQVVIAVPMVILGSWLLVRSQTLDDRPT